MTKATWWKAGKCDACGKKLKHIETGQLHISTTEGIVEMDVCSECEYFWNKSAEVFENTDNDRNKVPR